VFGEKLALEFQLENELGNSEYLGSPITYSMEENLKRDSNKILVAVVASVSAAIIYNTLFTSKEFPRCFLYYIYLLSVFIIS
jgi:hypothetical protein